MKVAKGLQPAPNAVVLYHRASRPIHTPLGGTPQPPSLSEGRGAHRQDKDNGGLTIAPAKALTERNTLSEADTNQKNKPKETQTRTKGVKLSRQQSKARKDRQGIKAGRRKHNVRHAKRGERAHNA
jgi:hypothetical protein